MATRIQLRRGTAAQWTNANPVLASGEPAVETDTGKRKIGDGVTAWADLPYDLSKAEFDAMVHFGGDKLTSIQQAIDACAANGGGTVVLSSGASIPINGTIHMRSHVKLDLNGATLTAVDNANFDEINLGTRETNDEAYNPANIKPIIAIMGEVGSRLIKAEIANGTINGNGLNQPDEGSYANVIVFLADDCKVDVTSVNARPDITVNLSDGSNTGRRAFCLLIGRAKRTLVHGYYDDAGYDVISVRDGANDTLLDKVFAGKGEKASVQCTSLSTRTRIVNSVLDNSEGTSVAPHSLFCHSAKGVTVENTSLINRSERGSAFLAFGDTSSGPTEDVKLSNCYMEQGGSEGRGLFILTTPYVRRISATDITYKKVGNGQTVLVQDASREISFTRWRGTTESTSANIRVSDAQDVEFIDCEFETPQVVNGIVATYDANRVRIKGGAYSALGGPAVYLNGTSDVVVDGVRMVAEESVRGIGDSSNVDVLNCDLRGITNTNKLRLYGTTGRLRGNHGAETEGNGVATIPAGATSVTVTHGLWQGTSSSASPRVDRHWRPGDFQVSFASNPGSASKAWVSNVTPTQVTFTVDAAPGADIDLAWSAAMSRRS